MLSEAEGVTDEERFGKGMTERSDCRKEMKRYLWWLKLQHSSNEEGESAGQDQQVYEQTPTQRPSSQQTKSTD